MARPRRCRRICSEPAYDSFIPEGICGGGRVVMTVDEYEVIRLMDLEKFTQKQCARQMDISRTTVTEIYEAAREKIADSLVHGKPLAIEGGHYRLCRGLTEQDCRKPCRKKEASRQSAERKGADEMRIAVTYEDGKVFQHFGHTEQFKIYDIEDGAVTREQVVDTDGSGHGALAGFLTGLQVDALICGGIGGGAQTALAQAGIRLYGGVSGEADEAVKAFLSENLDYDPDVHCDHHGHDQDHQCGHEGGGGHCGHGCHGSHE